MATKKIKTFTVDEEIYNALVSMFKEYGADVSISYYLDGCLKDLLKYLRTLDDLRRREPEKYTAPMSYIIDMIAKEPKMSILDLDDEPGRPYVPGREELEEIQVRYEAERKKIPLRFWRFLRTGAYKMSADEKHVVNKRTGHAYEPDEGGLVTDAPEHDEPGTAKE
jgi:hypothetical protein